MSGTMNGAVTRDPRRRKTLKDEPIEYRKQQYDEKNMVLSQFGEQVSATTVYEDIFPTLDMIMPIVIINDDEQKHIVKMTLDEAIEQAEGRNDMLLGGSDYYNEFVSKATARNIYSFIIDMDNVYSGILLRALQHDWALESGEARPLPTYIVNSGTGLHLYFVLDKPLPHFKRNALNIDKLYRTLAEQQTTRRNYLLPQTQWFGQDFRMIGGNGKDGWENTAFRVGDKWSVEALTRACGLSDIEFAYDKAQSVNKAVTEPRKRKKGAKRKGFHTNRAFYDYALAVCEEKTVEGWRYNSMCALATIAYKCNVPIDEVRQDLKKLLPLFNKDAVRQVKEREIDSALKMYNEKAIDTPRNRLEDWQGWKYEPKIKRNGRKQAEHIKRITVLRDTDYPNGAWRNKEGRPSAAQTVRDWRQQHPQGSKAACIRETGLSKPTVYKWWRLTTPSA